MSTGVWLVLGADALSSIGTGLALPFLMVYLHTVRALPLATAGAVAATMGLIGVVGNPVGGAWADRFGPKPVLVGGWALAALGAGGIAAVSRPWQAFTAAGLCGLGTAIAWPARDTLLAQLVPEADRSSVFALRSATLNAGAAIGGLTAALIADTRHPSSFVLLYVLDAASFVLAIPLLWPVRGHSPVRRRPAPPRGRPAAPHGVGYRAVLRDRVFWRLWLLIALLVAVGFAQLNSAFPVYIVASGHPAGTVGLAFAANTVTVTACQLVVLHRLRGRSRTGAVTALCGLWVICWGTVLLAGHLAGGIGTAAFIAAAVVFGLGETLFPPSLPAVVNDIAPTDLRGRYNGAAAFAFTTGFALGPATAGIMLQHHLAWQLFTGFALASAAAAALARSTRRRLPPQADIIHPVGRPARKHTPSQAAPAAPPVPKPSPDRAVSE